MVFGPGPRRREILPQGRIDVTSTGPIPQLAEPSANNSTFWKGENKSLQHLLHVQDSTCRCSTYYSFFSFFFLHCSLHCCVTLRYCMSVTSSSTWLQTQGSWRQSGCDRHGRSLESVSENILSMKDFILSLIHLSSPSSPSPRPAIRPNTEPQKDDKEGEDSLLSDSEEMDLLGEIFETLSSRNLHERGPLYGTRSLDLFGSDSNNFIMKVSRTRGCKQTLPSAVFVITSTVVLTVRLSVQPQSGEPDSVHERQRQPAQLES